MKKIIPINLASIILFLLLASVTFAQHPISTSQFIDPYSVSLIGKSLDKTNSISAIGSASASAITWSNGGGDNIATNPLNWSGGIAPQDSDSVSILHQLQNAFGT